MITNKIPKNTLIYDIECATYGYDVSDTKNHKMKFFGAYSYKTKQYYVYQNLSDIQKIINQHKFIVGFNTKNYDNPIIEQSGIDITYKIKIDLYKIIQQRMSSIKFKDSVLAYHLPSLSLDVITQVLGLTDDSSKKLDFDYTLLNKEEFMDEEITLIETYTKRDIEITKKLWEYVVNTFDSWKHHLHPDDAKKLKHLSCAPSVYAYKVICDKVGLEEIYDDDAEYTSSLREGGYVAYPACEKLEGNIYCLDFASLYPHIMIQCNLYGRNKQVDYGWHGNDKFKINGYYENKDINKISWALLQIYKERKELKKKKDKKEYGLKIVMNTIYGLLRNPVFKSVFDDVAGNDCCLLAQQWIKLAMQKYKDEGYNVFYGDTDSVYLEDVFNDEEKMLRHKEEVIADIKNNIPFPQDTFDMDIDYKIDFIHFFKGGHKKEDSEVEGDDIKNKELGLMKKNYIFVYDDKGEKKVFIKNLGIVKRSNSKLSKKIFWEKMTPYILKSHVAKFPDQQIKEWIHEELNKDIYQLSKRVSVKKLSSYKSKNCMNAQAHEYIPKGETSKLGPGFHFLIPNKKFGIGKSMAKYCTIQEYKKYLTYNDLNLNPILKELKYFNSEFELEILRKKKYIPIEKRMEQKGLW